mmetsp:Transcript_41485/g.68009  ORF Transcript_41485/g.68009 Transcript_41485/m.68009 type:complete len:84 (+) Transcript_41485:353-604(+)
MILQSKRSAPGRSLQWAAGVGAGVGAGAGAGGPAASRPPSGGFGPGCGLGAVLLLCAEIHTNHLFLPGRCLGGKAQREGGGQY